MKKIISLFMVILMVFSTAAIPGFAETITPSTSVEKELEIINPKLRGAGKTKKTKFGKSIYSNPISIYADNYDFDIYSVTIVSVELLNRYAKQKSKIKTKIEFVSDCGFYFHTNSPGRYLLKIEAKSTITGNILNFSGDELTEVYVPDSKYSFTKGAKTTLDLNKTSYYAGEDLPYEDYLPSVILARSESSTPVPGTYQEHELIGLSGISPGWKLYSDKNC